jgi:hypothetical protein
MWQVDTPVRLDHLHNLPISLVVLPPNPQSHTQQSIPVFTNEDYLAELLVEGGIIDAEQLKSARASLSGGMTIVQHLINRSEVTETQIAETLASNAGIPFVDLAGFHFDPAVILTVSEDTARRYRVIPVTDDGLITHKHSSVLAFQILLAHHQV